MFLDDELYAMWIEAELLTVKDVHSILSNMIIFSYNKLPRYGEKNDEIAFNDIRRTNNSFNLTIRQIKKQTELDLPEDLFIGYIKEIHPEYN